jgi:hypothetical protein
MQNQQLPEQCPDGESKREYKSPTLRKLGKLSDVTLTVGMGTANDGMILKVS